jgi:3-methyladenine DNA glycosylase AlkD
MDKVSPTIKMMRKFFNDNADLKIVKKYSRFFKDGYDAYGIENNLFLAQLNQWFEQLKQGFKLAEFKKLFVELQKSGKYEEISTSIWFLTRLKKYHTKTLFKQIMTWVDQYYTNWAHVDVLSGQVLSAMVLDKVITLNDLLVYHENESKWIKRCIPVTMVSVFQEENNIQSILKVGNLMLNDPVREVGQGVGWMLREAWKKYPEKIEKLLIKHIKTGNRTAYQYTCEKMDKEYRKKFRRPKL